LWAEIINNNKTRYHFTREHYCFFVVCHVGTSTAQHARYDTTRTTRRQVLWHDATSGILAYVNVGAQSEVTAWSRDRLNPPDKIWDTIKWRIWQFCMWHTACTLFIMFWQEALYATWMSTIRTCKCRWHCSCGKFEYVHDWCSVD